MISRREMLDVRCEEKYGQIIIYFTVHFKKKSWCDLRIAATDHTILKKTI